MPPFQYTPDPQPYVGSIADTMLRQGDIAAQRAQQQGQIWGNATQNIGQGFTTAIAQQNDPRRQIEQMQLGQMRQSQVINARVNAVMQHVLSLPSEQQRTSLEQGLASTGMPYEEQQKILAAHTKSGEDQAKLFQAHREAEADLGNAIHQSGDTEDAFVFHTADWLKSGALSPTRHQALVDALAKGMSIPDLTKGLMAGSKEYDKTVTIPPTPAGGAPGTVLKPSTGETVGTGAAAPPKPLTETELALKAAHGDPELAMRLVKGGKETNEWTDFKQATAKALGVANWDALTPSQQTSTVNRFKLIGPESAQAAATNRQTATIAAQIAQQKRAQDFEVLKEARQDIDKNVNTPYATARTSAATLRDVVASAQAGNKVAGALQSLETTMAAIRAQGLNRINTAEIGVTANAGSLWDRLQGWFRKASSGEPVPAPIQKDMLEFASILEKAAYKKYSDAHEATNTLWGTSIPKTYSAPVDPLESAKAKLGGR